MKLNLETQTQPELLVLVMQMERHPRKFAELLWGKPLPKGALTAVRNLKNFGWNLLTANGLDLEAGRQYYEICERIYQELPEYAQWRRHAQESFVLPGA